MTTNYCPFKKIIKNKYRGEVLQEIEESFALCDGYNCMAWKDSKCLRIVNQQEVKK